MTEITYAVVMALASVFTSAHLSLGMTPSATAPADPSAVLHRLRLALGSFSWRPRGGISAVCVGGNRGALVASLREEIP